jgi:acetamidase/formamidase
MHCPATHDTRGTGTAIETPIKATFRFTVRKDMRYVKTPHFKTPPVRLNEGEEYYCTTGVAPSACQFITRFLFRSAERDSKDLEEAARAATRNMIDYLCAEKGLSRVDAYFLCSVTCDLRMHEVVRTFVSTSHTTSHY